LQQVLEKLVKFIGKNVTNLVERDDEKYCFRLHKNRVYYVREELVKRATNVRFLVYVSLGVACCARRVRACKLTPPAARISECPQAIDEALAATAEAQNSMQLPECCYALLHRVLKASFLTI
jgi:hypothetical protein